MARSAVSGVVALSALVLCAGSSAQPTPESRCAAHIEQHPNEAHTNPDCLLAAEQGNAVVQYAVGMSFGFAGDGFREALWYLRAANGGFVEAYLAMGHVMRSAPINDLEQAILWYTRYWDAGGKAKGYAAELLRQIEAARSNKERAQFWLKRCEETGYQGCGQGKSDVPAA
jgi:hypothetical protein